MKVNRLAYENYRNLQKGSIEPSNGINVLYGNNAQGKTNLIEALWLFCGQKSFRGSKDSELITFLKDFAHLKLDFFSEGREQEAEIKIAGKREIILNHVPLQSPSKMTERFCAVIFAPSHLSLIKDGPKARRQFLDIAVGQLRPGYIKILSSYNRAVIQRNALIKDVKFHSELLEMLDIYENKIAELGSRIIIQRKKYIESLSNVAPGIYEGLSSGKESFSLKYISSAENGEDRLSFEKALKKSREEDIQTGITSVGPHRDDIEFLVNSISLKAYGSQGQQRSAVLSLKLSEAEVLKRFTGEQPIAILDDVMSELDGSRQDYILNHIEGWQVFITCCDPHSVKNLNAGKTFKVENGIITPN